MQSQNAVNFQFVFTAFQKYFDHISSHFHIYIYIYIYIYVYICMSTHTHTHKIEKYNVQEIFS
jgi:hypothetical protein